MSDISLIIDELEFNIDNAIMDEDKEKLQDLLQDVRSMITFLEEQTGRLEEFEERIEEVLE